MAQHAFATLVGNLTRDPETTERNGAKVMSFTLAVNTSQKRTDGSYDSNFYDCSLWGEREVQRFASVLQKGTGCVVLGEIAAVEYQGTDGKQHTRLRCRVDKLIPYTRMKNAQGQTPPMDAVMPGDESLPF